MEHKEIQGKLLIYIDKELSDPEMMEIKAHIDICPDCGKYIQRLSGLWKSEKTEIKEAPEYIWTRLGEQIKEYEQDPVLFDIYYFRKKFAYIIQPALIAVLVFVSVLTGYFGGNFLSKEINWDQAISNNEQVAKAFYLDRLETESISYSLIAASNEKGEEVLP